MNKFYLLLVVMIIAISTTGCTLPKYNDIKKMFIDEPVVNNVENDDLVAKQPMVIGEYIPYKDDELGVNFLYPDNYRVKITEEMEDLDQGKIRYLRVISPEQKLIFSIRAVSRDYSQGVREGCCFYYAAEPIDLELPENELVEKLYDFRPFNLRKDSLYAKKSLRFYSIKEYFDYWIIDSILLPMKNNKYSNMLITGPIIKTISTDNDVEAVKKSVSEEIAKGKILEQEEVQVFDKILNSLKFTK